jgi:hypothetical protein
MLMGDMIQDKQAIYTGKFTEEPGTEWHVT